MNGSSSQALLLLDVYKEAMLADARGRDLLASGAPWKHLKPPLQDPGVHQRQRQPPLQDPGVHQRQRQPPLQDPGVHQRQRGGKNLRPTFSQRSCLFGVEFKPELVWEYWDLGREFTETLCLKNTLSKLQKLHVRPPVSKFFTSAIPKVIVLSPGTSFLTSVSFRPLQRREYEDSFEFHGNDGSFQVWLRATVPRHALEVPDSVQLPVCAVQNSSHATFLLKNVSELQTRFQWECAAPFQLSPERGLMKPGQECHITVLFRPQEALVYKQHANCRFGEEDTAEGCCTVLLQGLAKYPCLQLRNPGTENEREQCGPELHFGTLAIGKSLQKHFDIFNPSPVTASFSLSQLPSGVPLLGSEFSCNVSRGEVAPGESLRALVTYTPAVVDSVSVKYLSLKCKGALNDTRLKLTGDCVGPKVSLSCSVVDFGCVEEGGTAVQTMELVNSAPVQAVYQWDLDCSGNSVFSIQPASGTVCPHSHITLKAIYRPTQPMAHHRRVACIVLHRNPIFLDLVGTCHSELQQPAILKPEHLVLNKLHRSGRQDPPESLTAVQQDHNAHLNQEGVLCPGEEQPCKRPDKRSPMEEYYQTCLGCMDHLSCSSSSSPHVSVVPSELLFNHRRSTSLSTSSTSSQYVSITNHTRGDLSLVWTAAPDSPFTVSPSSRDLAPLKSTSFRVTYDPKQLNTLHGAQLECFAHYKRLQDNHGIEERPLCPPWCVTVRVIGHSFQSGKEHFIPRCSLKPPQVVFPALSVLSYRSVLLKNRGDLPVTFCLDHCSNPAVAEAVSVVPRCGLIQPRKHQILTLGTTPTEDSPTQGFTLRLRLNAADHTKELTVVSVVEKLCVSLEGGDALYFQPTAVGSRTRRSHRIRNLSLLPLRFQWSVPEPQQELICVEPDAGELHPNESSAQIWSFSPLEETTYTLKATLTFWPIQTPGCNKSHLPLKVVGVGSKGFIEAEKAVLDVGQILVGSCRAIRVPLVNNSPCSVSLRLSVQQILLDEQRTYDPETEPDALKLDCESATIASRCTMLLASTVRPRRRAQYRWTISYQMLNASGVTSSPPQVVCEVRAKGVLPTLQVVDVCSSDSAGRLSKVHIWKLFSLDSLNEHMLSNPAELTDRTPTRHSSSSCPSVFTRTMLDFNFSAAPLNSQPSTFLLKFHNPVSIPVDWTFLFPEDQQIELDYWAETGEFSSTELHQMKIQDHLFSISPRSGTLLPGQQRAVYFTYRHDFAGIHRFPVVLKLSYGREILLNFQGVTVERDRPYLHFATRGHVFNSVTIGDCAPLRQVYELHNGGAVPVRYEVDAAVLSQLQVDNFNHPVLCCLNPEGEVPPGKTAMLEWIFSPLEAKMYHMDVPIHVQDGDSTPVRFEGCGFDSPILRPSNPFYCSVTKTSETYVQRVAFPGQVVFLSEDSVSLGDIPLCSRSSRILFLTNVSHTDAVHYTWDQQSCQQVVQIHPERGSLGPGESALCVLTFTSSDYPTCYQLDVVCQVTQEVELTQYYDALQHWEEEEEERQQDEIIITDKSLTESQRVLEPLPTLVRREPPLRKYKTLPPICASGSNEAVITRAERRAQRQTAKARKRPETPQPALLHLGVTAHSHGLHDRSNEHYRCLRSVEPQQPATDSSSTWLPAGRSSVTNVPDRDVAVHVLSSLLGGILNDPAFTQSLITLALKPISYQVRGASPSHCSSSASSSSHPAPKPQVLLCRTVEQHSTVDSKGTARCSRNRPQAQDAPRTCVPRVPADVSEDVLLNTLQNLMMEAVRGELVLTAHPRAIILPPVSARTRGMCKAMAEEDTENVRNTKEPAGT